MGVGLGGVRWTIRLWRTVLFMGDRGHKSTACEACSTFSAQRPPFQQSINKQNQQSTLAAARPTHNFGPFPTPVFRNNSMPKSSSGNVSPWPSLSNYCNRLGPHSVAEDTKRDKASVCRCGFRSHRDNHDISHSSSASSMNSLVLDVKDGHNAVIY